MEVEGGYKAFSLVSPPMGSPATRRRIRQIMDNMVQSSHAGITVAARTPHVVTIAVTYNCQCDCAHCSAVDYQRENRRNGHALSYDELKSAIEQAVDLGTTCVILTGGEPLLFPRIYDLIASGGPLAKRLHHFPQRGAPDRARPWPGSRPPGCTACS